MKTIDLRSDTVTLPTEAMRAAISKAIVGDDVYEEDPTVNELQERIAKITGKDSALFVSSGTMGNLIALLAHCQRGDEAIIGDASHIAIHEQSGASMFGGISLKTVPNLADDRLEIKAVKQAINQDDIHYARSKLICLENTWNGYPLSPSYNKEMRELADESGLLVHLDGTRIFNAALALKISVDRLVEHCHSVQLCFSKGLAAPVGSIICGGDDFIKRAKRIRKALGGGMRQSGILAAACIVSLEQMIERLAEDHKNARLLADELAQISGIKVSPGDTQTNMVFFDVNASSSSSSSSSQAAFVSQLKERGVLVGVQGRMGIRAVTHYGITESDIAQVVERIKKLVLG